MLQYLKRQAMKLRSGLTKGIVLLLCLATLFSSAQLGGLALIAEAAEGDTVTVTVNYVYKSNSAMVAQPYTAQIARGAAFQKTIEVPYLFNYSIPNDQAVGLGSGIKLEKNTVTNKYSLGFDLSAVNEDITVNLYYVAGQAQYTVKHYYQNLENDEYTFGREVELTGDIDAYTNAVADSKPGFVCLGVPQTTVAADGTTVVEIYYDREYYTVTFDVSGGINGPEPIYAKYGTKFNVSDIRKPTRAGYKFMGWKDVSNADAEALSGEVEITENVTYTAQWVAEKGQADYSIVLWGQNANDNEYSYLGSYEAWGNVGNQVTWNEDTLISHVHTDDCWELTCSKEAHTHSAACGLNCTHTHDLTCYGLSANASAVNPNNETAWWCDSEPESYFEQLGLQDGYLYYDDENARYASKDNYYLRYDGKYYSLSQAQFNKLKGTQVGSTTDGTSNNPDYYYKYEIKTDGIPCTHTHTDACYACGKTEHTHNDSCGTLTCKIDTTPKKMSEIKPDSKLWNFKTSDTVTVDANGSTVLNVYFDRTTFTLTFKYQNKNNNWDTETIGERWGANVKGRFDAIDTKAKNQAPNRYSVSGWKDSTTNKYTNNVIIMPQTDKIFTAHYDYGSKNTMTYYVEDLNGNDIEIFKIEFNGYDYTVTADEYYELEGFTIDKARSTNIGDGCDGAKFYYTRNSYKLEFYSASRNDPEKTKSVKYQDSLSQYNYTPTAKPSTVEPNAVFVGWYLNPECTGEPFDLAAHVMPSHDIALYAKWVNGLFTVRTFTDEYMQTLYTYDGYKGVQENIVKYTLATAPADPKKDGHVFIGWFYKEAGVEKPFSFTMPITKDYNLYPKFSEPKAVTYTVHYYKAGTKERLASDSTKFVMIGTTVTEKAKMGKDLDLVDSGMQNKYYPTNTSTSEIIHQLNQEIIFYYTEATSVQYTVYYQDANRKDLIDPVTKTTEKSIVNEQYVPIPNYAPRQFSIMKELSTNEEENKIIFIYDPTLTTLTLEKQGWQEIDENQTFLFHVKGSPKDPNTKDVDLTVTIHRNGKTTVTDLPVGDYIITEETGWSWRYTPQSGGERTVTVRAGGLTVQYQNDRTETQWLDGDNYRVNHFDSKNQ